MKTLAAHLVFQFKRLIRLPGFWAPAVLFPAMLFSFFGVSAKDDPQRAALAMASFCVYAAVGVGFYQFGAGIAQDRESAFSTWTRTLPGANLPSLISSIAAAAVFSLAAVLLVIGAAHLFTDPAADMAAHLRLLGVCILIAIPAALMGVTLGNLASARAAVAVANLIFLPLAYLGGLWVPPQALPATIDKISQWTPTRHMGELAWHAVLGEALPAQSIAMMLGFTALFAFTAWAAAARDSKRRFA